MCELRPEVAARRGDGVPPQRQGEAVPAGSRPIAWCRSGVGRNVVPATAALMIVGLLTVRRGRRPAMAGGDRMTIEEVVRQVLREEHGDVIRESVRAVAQELMEAEVSELIGAERGERTEDRATHRNGYRARRWDTRAGEIELQIPKLRRGQLFPVVSCSRASARSRRWSRSSSRRMCAACRPGGSTSWSRPGAAHQPQRGQSDLRPAG